ncbi:hypothetical protein [Sphingomonas sp. PvP018]|uniref:hypothetical protein n=1 Tax=Sphingomonas sp. PvP018 TaxID=2817852 RepID=UPI001AE23BBE|nr:hypothetical protein [Sphingomonas sp. PvP018]MBP2512667.1 hypothetical protein [Sphingomonas sp. PvP018]
MTAVRAESIIAIAFAHSAEVQAWRLAITRRERKHINCTLLNLRNLGHVASFSIQDIGGGTVQDFAVELRSLIGSLPFDGSRDTRNVAASPAPAFLMPVWRFDHVVRGLPASTACLLGLDLELIASPSFDEELGAHLPGHNGRWLIHAHPMF